VVSNSIIARRLMPRRNGRDPALFPSLAAGDTPNDHKIGKLLKV